MRAISLSILAVSCALGLAGATSNSIGVVRSYGEMRIDGSAVRGNGTLVSGDVVESTTLNATANLGKAEVTLMPDSRVTVYKDHTTLQKGTTLLRGTSHAVEAGTLRVVPTQDHALVTVGYSSKKVISVSTYAGAAEVFTSSGQLVASLNPGGALSFEPGAGSGASGRQSGADATVQVKGVMTAKDGKYFVTMDGKVYEVTSSTINLAKYVGKTVNLTATVVSSTADLTVVSVGAVSALAGTGFGLATGLVIVGAATAATVGGLAATGSFSGGTSASVP